MVAGRMGGLSREYDEEELAKLALRAATSERESGGGCSLNWTLGRLRLRLFVGWTFSSEVVAEAGREDDDGRELADESCPWEEPKPEPDDPGRKELEDE